MQRGIYGSFVPPTDEEEPEAATRAPDLAQNFYDTGTLSHQGQRPQNFIREAPAIEDRYQDYPDQRELLIRKMELVNSFQTPAFSLNTDIRQLPLNSQRFGTRFDVILIDPPWQEYAMRAPGHQIESWPWNEIMTCCNIADLADTPSFIFLWCGNGQGLEAGRHCLGQWGFKRVEDIVWLKTNKESRRRRPNLEGLPPQQGANQVLVGTKEHCLVGVRGTLRRDMGEFVHSHCDVDLIISEEEPTGSTRKPEELYGIIERFCQGRRRLELFGEDHNVRDGWVTVGNKISGTKGKPFDPKAYSSYFRNMDQTVYVENTNRNQRVTPGAPNLLPFDAHIEELRPKSPPQPRNPDPR